MALDDETRRIVAEAMGSNALAQLETVIPDFFDGPYVVTALVYSAGKAPEIWDHIPKLDHVVVASNVPEYEAGKNLTVFWERTIPEIVGKGYNVSITPPPSRSAQKWAVRKDEFLAKDGFVAVEGSGPFWGTESQRVFYAHGEILPGGHEIHPGSYVSREGFNRGMRFCNMQFAFVPAGETPRSVVEIVDGKFAEGIMEIEVDQKPKP